MSNDFWFTDDDESHQACKARLECGEQCAGKMQAAIAQNVKERGYYARPDGTPWTPDELAARQALKSLSEAVEAVWCIKWASTGNVRVMQEAALAAKEMADFIFGQTWRDCVGAVVMDPSQMSKEIADVAIPMFVAANALGVSLPELMRSKSGADIQRGTGG